MTTLPPPATNKFPEGSLESQVYNIVENLKEFMPIINDRNRLGFALYLYMKGEGDKPEVLIKTLKLSIKNITPNSLISKIQDELQKVKM